MSYEEDIDEDDLSPEVRAVEAAIDAYYLLHIEVTKGYIQLLAAGSKVEGCLIKVRDALETDQS